ncbi:MAG: NAD-dependent epimerase/dehydratase family protein, partial [Gammaproteobacteria bacterium]|nr:NAD-dependent epimerase/dehydratase family protein [Gammaproteobacteria bacterium]
MSKLYLVTGGAGFIGSHITERLLAEGHRVRILDNFSTGKRENIPPGDDVEVIEGDVGDTDTVRRCMEGVYIVFHEAAIASVPETVGNPLGSERTNYRGTVNVLEAARQAGAKRVVFAC